MFDVEVFDRVVDHNAHFEGLVSHFAVSFLWLINC